MQTIQCPSDPRGRESSGPFAPRNVTTAFASCFDYQRVEIRPSCGSRHIQKYAVCEARFGSFSLMKTERRRSI